MPETDVSKPAEKGERNVTPYCGGCGHLYFNLPKGTAEVAKAKAAERPCIYCMDEKKKER